MSVFILQTISYKKAWGTRFYLSRTSPDRAYFFSGRVHDFVGTDICATCLWLGDGTQNSCQIKIVSLNSAAVAFVGFAAPDQHSCLLGN